MRGYSWLAAALVVSGCASAQVTSPVDTPGSPVSASEATVVRASQVDWQHLNPARGDLAPKAGTLWGDRQGTGPTGFLLKPFDGFESPPHIHNISYRGMVIRGQLHNDDPNAAELWMPPGSFWTQPRGHVHITAARGTDTLAYIEIEEGPYLVQPVDSAFPTPERPVNVDESNIVWVDPARIAWTAPPGATATHASPQLAFLWGDPHDQQPAGSLLKLPAGATSLVRTRGQSFRAVVIQGRPTLKTPTAAHPLPPGSYFGSTGAAAHPLTCDEAADCILYIRAEGPYSLLPSPAAPPLNAAPAPD